MSMSLYKELCVQTYEDAIEIGIIRNNSEIPVPNQEV